MVEVPITYIQNRGSSYRYWYFHYFDYVGNVLEKKEMKKNHELQANYGRSPYYLRFKIRRVFTGIDILFLSDIFFRILNILPKLSLCSFPERPVTGLALALAVGLVPLFGFPVKY